MKSLFCIGETGLRDSVLLLHGLAHALVRTVLEAPERSCNGVPSSAGWEALRLPKIDDSQLQRDKGELRQVEGIPFSISL